MTAVYLREFEPVEDHVVARAQLARPSFLAGQFPLAGREFPPGEVRNSYYIGYVPDYVSTPTIDLLWYVQGIGATGNVTWQSNIAAVTPGDAVRLSDKTFAASGNTVNSSPTGIQQLNKATITVTNTDSLAAGDLVIVRIARDPSNVSCGGTAVLIGISLNYTGS